MPHLLSALDLGREAVDELFEIARGYDLGVPCRRLTGKVVALAFFEPSLRTRVGFEVAAARLGAATADVSRRHTEQMSAPESFTDTMKVVGAYCDLICLRHADTAAPARAAEVSEAPVVNCGNGVDEHPTQALIDLYAIDEIRGGIDGLRIALVGDLRRMRAAHSLIAMLGRYDAVHVRCIFPNGRDLPRELVARAEASRGISRLEETADMLLEDIDIVYMAGLPANSPEGEVTAAVRRRYSIDRAIAGSLAPHVRILCPLPRVDEISADVDSMVAAGYFAQSALGLPMRMAILEHLLSPRTS